MNNTQATEYLGSFLGKHLRLHTTDTRMFTGEFKCTDNECNIILSQAYEYRLPTHNLLSKATTNEDPTSLTDISKTPMTSRFLGLIVVPGKHIVLIEAEEH